MSSLRHLLWFFYLSLSWAIVPSLYRLLANAHVPVSHTMLFSGVGVGIVLYLFNGWRSGHWIVTPPVLKFSAMVSLLANMPFAINLSSAGHVPPATNAIIVSTSPLVNYGIALITGWENASARRLSAVALGFLSTLLLIIPAEDTAGNVELPWVIVVMTLPFFYSLYNNYAARRWPRSAETGQIAALESISSGFMALPFALILAPIGASTGPPLSAYWLIVAAVAMWVFERIAYFTLIREKGAVYTGQASYLATPMAVVIASSLFGGAQDKWLWASLALLMVALYLNNSGREGAKPTSS